MGYNQTSRSGVGGEEINNQGKKDSKKSLRKGTALKVGRVTTTATPAILLGPREHGINR